jgi:hypothetical protein
MINNPTCRKSSMHMNSRISPADLEYPPAALNGSQGRLPDFLPQLSRQKIQNASSNSCSREADAPDNISKQQIIKDYGMTNNLRNQKKQAMEDHFRDSMITERHFFGHTRKDSLLEQAVSQGTAGSVWDTSHPVAATLSKPWTTLLIAGCALFMGLSLFLTVARVQRNNLREGNSFRFTTLQHRNAVQNPNNSGISEFGLLRDGCEVDMRELSCNVTMGSRTITILCAHNIQINGWWFETSNKSVGFDPIRFYLEICYAANCVSWDKIGSSSVIWLWWGSPFFTDNLYNTSSERLHKEMFDMRIPWILARSNIASCTMLLLICLMLLIVLLRRDRMIAVPIIAAGCAAVSTIQLLSCIGCLLIGQLAPSIYAGGISLVYFGLAAVMTIAESSFIHSCAAAGIGQVAFRLIHDEVFLSSLHIEQGGTLALENPFSITFIPLLIASLVAYFTRLMSRRHAERIIAPDRQWYNECWHRLLQDDTGREDIQLLAEYVDRISRSFDMPSVPVRQRGRNTVTAAMGTNSHQEDQSDTGSNLGPFVQDLDQLFAQAKGLDPFLRAKVCEWASMSCALLPVALRGHESTVEYKQWSEIAETPRLHASIKWARPKARQRAVEKLFRSYNFDVSRLLDCCRQSLYFETIGGLLICLQTINSDPSVQVLRMHNKLRPTYDATATAGYRDVLVNLRVKTEEAALLGVDWHVCEVQLVLLEFAKAKVRCFPSATVHNSECV